MTWNITMAPKYDQESTRCKAFSSYEAVGRYISKTTIKMMEPF